MIRSRPARGCLAVVLRGYSPAAALAAPGDLDPSFGTGGRNARRQPILLAMFLGILAVLALGGLLGAGNADAKRVMLKRVVYPVTITIHAESTEFGPDSEHPGQPAAVLFGLVKSRQPVCIQHRSVFGLMENPRHPPPTENPVRTGIVSAEGGAWQTAPFSNGPYFGFPSYLDAVRQGALRVRVRVKAKRLGGGRVCQEATSVDLTA